jgi:hypothetical protein
MYLMALITTRQQFKRRSRELLKHAVLLTTQGCKRIFVHPI